MFFRWYLPVYLLAPMADAEVGEGSGFEGNFEPQEEALSL